MSTKKLFIINDGNLESLGKKTKYVWDQMSSRNKDIYTMRLNGYDYTTIAEKYGICTAYVGEIIRKINYRLKRANNFDNDHIANDNVFSLPLTNRTYRALVRGNMESIKDIIEEIERGTLQDRVRNFGERSFDELVRVLTQEGYKFYIPIKEKKKLRVRKNATQSERQELFGNLIDVVEDWLELKGITIDDVPNDDREDENAAIIYGDDYDYLADRFAEVLGIDRDCVEMENDTNNTEVDNGIYIVDGDKITIPMLSIREEMDRRHFIAIDHTIFKDAIESEEFNEKIKNGNMYVIKKSFDVTEEDDYTINSEDILAIVTKINEDSVEIVPVSENIKDKILQAINDGIKLRIGMNYIGRLTDSSFAYKIFTISKIFSFSLFAGNKLRR